MTNNEYKELIMQLLSNINEDDNMLMESLFYIIQKIVDGSKDTAYIIAVLIFVKLYPNKKRGCKKTPFFTFD